MKKYLCRVYNSGEYSTIDYAYVEIDEGLKAFIEHARKGLGDLAKHKDFLRVELFHLGPVYLESLPDELEEHMDALNCGDYVELPADTPAPESDVRLDFSEIEIENDGFRWSCGVKHSSLVSTTATFRYADVGWPELTVPRED